MCIAIRPNKYVFYFIKSFMELNMESDKDKLELEQRLADLRSDIDNIDGKIVRLINKRLEIGKKIGEIKEKKGSEVLDRNREKKIMQRLMDINTGPADDDVLKYIFSVIMTATRQIQKSNRISYLGPEASYTHIAALHYFRHSGNFIEQPDLVDIFRDVEKKESRFGVVPVENSIEGAVNHTLDLFCEFDVQIIGEHYEHIYHDILSLSGDLRDVQTIYSHPQALAQCRRWVRKKLPEAKIIETSSTSQAARLASEDRSFAAIASSRAAHLYGLQVVEARIEDHSDNITRFLILGRDKHISDSKFKNNKKSNYFGIMDNNRSLGSMKGVERGNNIPDNHKVIDETEQYKTSLMFATSHVPGALFKVLECVNRAGLNMVKLESRPTKNQNWTYYFFMDLEGHIMDKIVSETIDEMRENSLFLKVLGSYPVFA